MFAGVLALGPLKCYDISVCKLRREDIMIQIIIQIGVGVGIAILLIFIINRIFNRLYRVNQGIHLKFFRSLANGLVGIITIYYCCSLFDTTKEIVRCYLDISLQGYHLSFLLRDRLCFLNHHRELHAQSNRRR